MPTEMIRGIRLYYEIHGAGPRLLYIGGSGGDLRQKPSVFEGPLARNFEVLSFDQRGLGQIETASSFNSLEKLLIVLIAIARC